MTGVLNFLSSIIKIVLSLFGTTKRRKINKRIKSDNDIADAIRKGDGQEIAEEWKRRKKYNYEP